MWRREEKQIGLQSEEAEKKNKQEFCDEYNSADVNNFQWLQVALY